MSKTKWVMDNIIFPKVKLPLKGLIFLFIFISLVSFYAIKVSYVVAVPIHQVSFDVQQAYFTGVTLENNLEIIQGKSHMYLKQTEGNNIPIKYINYSRLGSDTILITFENLGRQANPSDLGISVDSILVTSNLFNYVVHNVLRQN